MDAEAEVLAVARVRAHLRSGRARQVRERAGVTQAEAGAAIGTDGPQVNRWENGKSVPRFESALKLGALLEKLAEIIAEEELGVPG